MIMAADDEDDHNIYVAKELSEFVTVLRHRQIFHAAQNTRWQGVHTPCSPQVFEEA